MRAFLVQLKVVENHQNGKDTHVRGLKIYAKDDRIRGEVRNLELMGILPLNRKRKGKEKSYLNVSEGSLTGSLIEPDWMGEPELR